MNRKNKSTAPQALEEVRGQFETWRATRKKRAPIPEPLWKAAVTLSRGHGVNKVAKALKLDYYALKKRVFPDSCTTKPAKDPRPTFVELNLPNTAVSTEWVVEMENLQGVKMKIHHKGQHGADLMASLLREFWSQ